MLRLWQWFFGTSAPTLRPVCVAAQVNTCGIMSGQVNTSGIMASYVNTSGTVAGQVR